MLNITALPEVFWLLLTKKGSLLRHKRAIDRP